MLKIDFLSYVNIIIQFHYFIRNELIQFGYKCKNNIRYMNLHIIWLCIMTKIVQFDSLNQLKFRWSYNITPYHINRQNSYMSQSLVRPLNESIKESIEPIPMKKSQKQSVVTTNEFSQSINFNANAQNPSSSKKTKVAIGCGICLIVVGLLMMLLMPPLIHSQIVSTVTDQSILNEDNQEMWAHYPGSTGTIITRNYSFFKLLNQQQFLIRGQKPKFMQIYGYKVQQLQDYIDIKYNQNGNKAQFIDWLHFQQYKDSKNIDEKVSILNYNLLGYWHTMKDSRDQIIFIQGLSVMFTNMEKSILDTVIGQGVASQYLTDPQTTFNVLLQPAGVSFENSFFIWNDDAYGFSDKNNLKYWVEAVRTSFVKQQAYFSSSALSLMDYFTLSQHEMYQILLQLKQFIESLEDLIINNHYCQGIEVCDGREMAIRQIAQSYVTYNTPPTATVTPTDSICENNSTCQGYHPQIASYYKNVYLKQHPKQYKSLRFDVQTVRKWMDYNPTRKQGEYSKHQAMLLHIGNLDALFENGTNHDQVKKNHEDSTFYLWNIMNRFSLQSLDHARVFWEWIKYLSKHLIRQNTGTNQILGIANLFSSTISDAFAFLQDNLQLHLLKTMISNTLHDKNCKDFLDKSFDIQQSSNQLTFTSTICDKYNNNISSFQFVLDAINLCKYKFNNQWKQWNLFGAEVINLENFCDRTNADGFGGLLHKMRVQLDKYYDCSYTPDEYCSDYELALKQWSNSTITLNPPASTTLGLNILQKSTTFSSWNSSSLPFQLYHYVQKTPSKQYPYPSIQQSYRMFNYDGIFNPSYNLRVFKNKSQELEPWRNYIRYVVIFISLKFTTQRSVREAIFGYDDQYLTWRKNRYPPFGGDPATPNNNPLGDPNITRQQATLKIQIYTGKDNPLMPGQYYKINNLTYIAKNTTKFNGNNTQWQLQSPWGQIDYFYGTNGKKFPADQHTAKNISIYVPNLQRYGSAEIKEGQKWERYGFQLELAELGEYMYQPMEQNKDNDKYYQHYFGTSMMGCPIFMTKHHFLNNSNNWTTFIEVYDQNHTRVQAVDSHFQDSSVLYQPYSGIAFQSTLYLQANYLHQPDNLFTYPQTTLLPIFTVNRSGNMTEQTATKLLSPLMTALSAKVVIFYAGIGVIILGIVLIGLAVYMIKKNRNNRINNIMQKNRGLELNPEQSGSQVSKENNKKNKLEVLQQIQCEQV